MRFFFHRLFNFLHFLFLKKEDKKFVVYSEGANYKYYFFDFIKVITTDYNKKIIYISSEKEDFIDDKNVKNIYIGKGFLRTIFFATLSCKYLILTLTDLGNSYIKKSKLCEKYIYIFHSPISTHVGYKKNAYWNYDVILCNGDYQFNEIREAEKKYNLNKKNLIKSGYLYFDYLRSIRVQQNNKKNNLVILAPTWVNNKENLFEDYSYKIIDILLQHKFRVVLRPHPEHFKISKKIIKRIKDNFSYNENFYFEENINDFSKLKESDLLITDYSGISIEYLLIYKKPVIFVNSSQKINNDDYKELKIEHIEKKIRRNFGYEIDIKDINNIKKVLDLAVTNGIPQKDQSIENFINSNFYNIGKVKNTIADLIVNENF